MPRPSKATRDRWALRLASGVTFGLALGLSLEPARAQTELPRSVEVRDRVAEVRETRTRVWGGGGWVEEVGYLMGDTRSAAVEVVEFGDFACSACREFWERSWPQVRTELVATGRVRWRHVPFLLGFRRGRQAADAAECAGEQEGFWGMHDRLFEMQAEWMSGRDPDARLLGYAAGLGLDARRFASCYEDRRGEHRTDAANRAAREAGVRATPTFMIDGRRALGALSFEHFLSLVEEAERARGGPGAR